MDSLAVTAITDFILAGEALFLAGMLVQVPKAGASAAWWWCAVMLSLGIAGLIAGIDHGFIEAEGLSRVLIQRTSWCVLGGMTLAMVLTIATQFFGGRAARLVAGAGFLQFMIYTLAVPSFDSYAIVIVDYAPVLLVLLWLNFRGLRSGTGSWPMIAGLLVLALASALQALNVDGIGALDHNVLYHLFSLPGILLLYLGGRRLRREIPP